MIPCLDRIARFVLITSDDSFLDVKRRDISIRKMRHTICSPFLSVYARSCRNNIFSCTRYADFYLRCPSDKRNENGVMYKKTYSTYYQQRVSRPSIVSSDDKQHVYQQAMNDVLSSKKFETTLSSLESQGLWSKHMYRTFRNWLLSKDILVHNDILAWEQLQEDWFSRSCDNTSLQTTLMGILNLQRDLFEGNMIDFNDSNKGFSPHEFIATLFPLTKMIFKELSSQYSNQTMITTAVWRKVKESGIVLDESSSEALLSSYHDKASNINEETVQSLIELAMYHEILYKATKSTTIIRTIKLVTSGNVATAEAMVRSSAHKYENSSIVAHALEFVLQGYCESNNIKAAVSLLKWMRRKGLKSSMKMYVMLISTLSENHCLR